MATPIILSTGSVSGAGTAGQGRKDLVIGETVTFSDTEALNSGASYSWTVIDAPIGSTAPLLNPTTATPSFVPDIEGSWRIQATVNGTDTAIEVVAVPLPNTNARIPSFQEEFHYDGGGNAKGWHEAMDQFMRQVDATNTHNTLGEAYNQNGPGAGAQIVATSGPVDIVNSNTTPVNQILRMGYGGGRENRTINVDQLRDGVGSPKQYLFLNGALGDSSTLATPVISSTFAQGWGLESTDTTFAIIHSSNGTNQTINRPIEVTSGADGITLTTADSNNILFVDGATDRIVLTAAGTGRAAADVNGFRILDLGDVSAPSLHVGTIASGFWAPLTGVLAVSTDFAESMRWDALNDTMIPATSSFYVDGTNKGSGIDSSTVNGVLRAFANSGSAPIPMLFTHTGNLNRNDIVQRAFEFNFTANQSGTAGYRGLQITVSETATGSGERSLISVYRGGGLKFNVDAEGVVHTPAGIEFVERTDHALAPVAARGQLWLRNDTPNELIFTDDEGTDWVLAAISDITLQQAYDGGSTNPTVINLDSTRGRIIIRDENPTLSSNLLQTQNDDGTLTSFVAGHPDDGGLFKIWPSSNNDVQNALRIARVTTPPGVGANGIGAAIDWELQNTVGAQELAAQISVSYTNATDGAENTDYTISLRDGGQASGTVTDRFNILSSGSTSILMDNLAEASTSSEIGLLLDNATAATVGTDQHSPMLVFRGQGWETTGGSSDNVRFAIKSTADQGNIARGGLDFLASLNDGSYISMFRAYAFGDNSYRMLAPSNAAGSPFYTFSSSNTTGMYLPAVNELGLSTSGVEALRINTAQQTIVISGSQSLPGLVFGGDTSTGIWKSTGAELAISTNGTTGIYVTGSQRVAFQSGLEGTPTLVNLSDLGTGMWWPAVNTVAVSTNGTEAVRWNATQQTVLPSGSNTNPSLTFEIEEDTGFYSSGANTISITSNNIQSAIFNSSNALFRDGTNNLPGIGFISQVGMGIFKFDTNTIGISSGGTGVVRAVRSLEIGEGNSAASSTTNRPSLYVLPQNVGNLTASTEFHDVYFDLGRTITWTDDGDAETSDLTLQRSVRIDAPTYASTAAGTVFDNAATMWLEGPPVAGTNMSLPRVNTFFVESGISVFNDGIELLERADHLRAPGVTRGHIWLRNDTPNVLVFTDDAGTDWVFAGTGVNTSSLDDSYDYTGGGAGRTILIDSGPLDLNESPDSSLVSNTGIFYIEGDAHAARPVSEYHDIYWNLGQTKQFTTGGGTIPTQRSFRILPPTYSANTNAVTITDGIGFELGEPVAGTNVTITNPYSIKASGTVWIEQSNSASTKEQLKIRQSIVNDAVRTGLLYGYSAFTSNRSISLQQIANVGGAKQYLMLNGGLGTSSTFATPVLTSTFTQSWGIEATDTELSFIHATNGTNQTIDRPIEVGTGANTITFRTGGTDAVIINSSQQALFQGGSAAAPGMAFDGDDNTGMFQAATNQMGISINGTQAVFFNGNQQAGFTDGTEALPAITFFGDNDSGLWRLTTNTVVMSTGSTEAMRWNSTQNTIIPQGKYISFDGNSGTAISSPANGRLNFGYGIGTQTIGLSSNSGSVSGSSSVQNVIQHIMAIDQSGTAGYRGMQIYVFENTTGSGETTILSLWVDPTNVFRVGNGGQTRVDDTTGLFGFTADQDNYMELSGTNQLGFVTAGTTALTLTSGQSMIVGTDGTAGAPAIQFSDTNTGIYLIGNNHLAFSAAGSAALDLNSNTSTRLNTHTNALRISQPVMTGVTPNEAIDVAPGAHTNITASTEWHGHYFRANTFQWATGNITTERFFRIDAPIITFAGASTITNAATVYVDNTPIAGTNATITNFWNIWADNGVCRFDDGVEFEERAAVAHTPLAGHGILWVRNDTPSVLMFTDDGGTDYVLNGSGAGGNTLENAYNEGGAGSGRIVDVNDGAILFRNTTADTTNIFEIDKSPSSSAAGHGILVTMGANATGNGITITNSGSGNDLSVGAGSVTKASISVSEADTGLFSESADTLSIAANSHKIMSLDGAAPEKVTTFAALHVRQESESSLVPSNAFNVLPGTHTGGLVNSELPAYYLQGATWNWATGTLALQRWIRIDAPTYTAGSAKTITDASTLHVSGQPIAGTNVTITNAYAFWVDAGIARFDGDGTYVFQVPQDDTDPTATVIGRIPINVNGTLRYLAYYDN